MRANLIIIALLLSSFYGTSQNWVQNTRAVLPHRDSLTPVEKYKVTKSEILLYEDSTLVLDQMIASYFSKHRTASKTKLCRSYVLDQLGVQLVSGVSLKKSYKSEKHRSVLRKIMKALLGIQRTFGLIEFTSFELQLVQVPNTYFYDEEAGKSAYHLYKGKKPTKSELENGSYVYKPCKIYTEQEILRKIEFELRSSRIFLQLTKKQVQTFGISILPNQRTLHKKAKPTVKVVILAGIRRIDVQKLASGKYKSAIRKNKRFYQKELKNVQQFLRGNGNVQ